MVTEHIVSIFDIVCEVSLCVSVWVKMGLLTGVGLRVNYYANRPQQKFSDTSIFSTEGKQSTAWV